MKPSKDLDEQMDEILAAIYLAGTENGLSRTLTDRAEIMHRKEAFIKSNPANSEAKQQLLALIEQREREASISGIKYVANKYYDELGDYVEVEIDNYIEALQKGTREVWPQITHK